MTDSTLDDPPDSADADATDEAGDADAPAERTGGTRTTVLVLAISLAVLFAIAAAILAVVAAGDDSGDDGERSLRRAAGTFGEALFTYDFHDPEAHRDSVLALSTGSFRSEYDDAFDQGLAELITKVQATSRGFVKDVYISEIDAERGEAIVVADIEQDGSAGPRTVNDVYVLLTFVRVGDTWKVDQLTDLNFAAAGAEQPITDPATEATTPSTAPVP